ncbi:hypothetical protein J6590_101336, partial [Homalodisca vitripennis]
MLKGPSRNIAANALRMSRTEIRKVTGFITGHWIFRSHLNRIAILFLQAACWWSGSHGSDGSRSKTDENPHALIRPGAHKLDRSMLLDPQEPIDQPNTHLRWKMMRRRGSM